MLGICGGPEEGLLICPFFFFLGGEILNITPKLINANQPSLEMFHKFF